MQPNIHSQEQSGCYANLAIVDCRFLAPETGHTDAGSIAVVGSHIAYLGRERDIRTWIGNKTIVLDAKGNTVLPGLIDSHVHFKDGGFSLSRIQLRDAKSPDEFTRRIGKYARQIPAEEWILGGHWDHELWTGSPLPTREWIDGCTPDNPVVIDRYDGHMALANSRALHLAGVSRDTADPSGGKIERDANSEPTGLLKDEAIAIVQKIIPQPSEDQKIKAIKAALAEARRCGVTGIHDNAGPDDVALYQKLYEQGELTCRVYCMLPVERWKALVDAGIRAPFGNDWIRLGALKVFADGSLGASTALFFESYVDTPGNSGLAGPAILPENSMLEIVRKATRHGLQVCIHAIGDKANHLVLNLFEMVANAEGESAMGSRFRIEHAQHLRLDDMARFASLGVIASMQPIHLVDDGCWAEKRIAHDRCQTAYAFKSLLNRQVRLAFGTDWPVAPLNPLLGIQAAVTRQTSDGKNPGGWFPGERVTLQEAFEAYTMGGAYAEFAETDKGSLTIGKLADIVVLDAEVSDMPPEHLENVKVLYTIVGGKIVYRAEKGTSDDKRNNPAGA